MKKTAPVYIIDDDQDDKHFIEQIFEELERQNRLYFFSNGKEMLAHFKNIQENPYLILCDVNTPEIDGFHLRQLILDDQNLVYKSIPFIFWSTFASNTQIKKAYDLSVHGFFFKGKTYSDMKNSLTSIFNYWDEARHPED